MMNVSKPSGIPGVPKVTEAGLADLGWSTEEYRGACVKTGALNIQCLIPYAISAVLGALFAIVLSRLIGPTADAQLIAIMVVSFFSMLVATLGVALIATQILLIAPFMFIGIVTGVVANAAYDWLVNRADHNLLPIEIVVMAVFAIPGVTAGMGLAWRLRRHLE